MKVELTSVVIESLSVITHYQIGGHKAQPADII